MLYSLILNCINVEYECLIYDHLYLVITKTKIKPLIPKFYCETFNILVIFSRFKNSKNNIYKIFILLYG